jgi:hypothetical protein
MHIVFLLENTYFDSIPQYHFGDVNAGWWYIKHECNVIRPPNSPTRSLASSNNMTLVSNDPSWWPIINASLIGRLTTFELG